MSWQGPEFVVAIVAITTIGWLVNNWIRARHGYALEDEWGGKTARAASLDAEALRTENAKLAERIAALEQRAGVVERIVTDRGYDVALQIEGLRDGTVTAPLQTAANQ